MAEEKAFEKQLVQAVMDHGGMALKQTSQYHRGIPDRLCILPDGRVEWVELKSVGKKPTKLQQFAHVRLRRLGQRVTVIDSRETLKAFIDTL